MSVPRGLRARGELGRGVGARERNGPRGEGVSWARGRGKDEGWAAGPLGRESGPPGLGWGEGKWAMGRFECWVSFPFLFPFLF